MRKVSACMVAVCLVALAAVAWGSPQDASKIDGTWTVVGGSSDGQKIPEQSLKETPVTMELKNGKYTLFVAGKKLEAGTYRLDINKKPATIDLSLTAGADKGKTLLGIFKLASGQLTIAMSKAGVKLRPKNFEPADGIDTLELKRK